MVKEGETLEVLLVDDGEHVWIGRSEDRRSGREELVEVFAFPPTLTEKRQKHSLSRLEHMVTPTANVLLLSTYSFFKNINIYKKLVTTDITAYTHARFLFMEPHILKKKAGHTSSLTSLTSHDSRSAG